MGWDSHEECVRGVVLFLPGAQGPPQRVHGGAIFTILDEGCGQWYALC